MKGKKTCQTTFVKYKNKNKNKKKKMHSEVETGTMQLLRKLCKRQ